MNEQIVINGLNQTSENREFVLSLVEKIDMNAKVTINFVEQAK